MKNIHLLSTPNPSKLAYKVGNISQKECLFRRIDYSFINGDGTRNQNIYITSNEEIEESQFLNKTDYYYVKNHYNEWYVGKFNGVSFDFINDNGNFHSNLFVCKKIILTTDQDLIKNGIQAIPDEFLEWFVKNPSCEEVEVEIESKFDRVDGHYHDVWEIIIPSKDDLKIGDNTNFGIITDINEKSVCFGKNKVGVDVWYKKSYVVKFPNLVLEEPKQETLEEAKIKHIKFCIENNIENPSFSFDKGVKWEQEQNEILLNEYHEYTVECIEVDLKRPLPFKSWFKQNKKK